MASNKYGYVNHNGHTFHVQDIIECSDAWLLSIAIRWHKERCSSCRRTMPKTLRCRISIARLCLMADEKNTIIKELNSRIHLDQELQGYLNGTGN